MNTRWISSSGTGPRLFYTSHVIDWRLSWSYFFFISPLLNLKALAPRNSNIVERNCVHWFIVSHIVECSRYSNELMCFFSSVSISLSLYRYVSGIQFIDSAMSIHMMSTIARSIPRLKFLGIFYALLVSLYLSLKCLLTVCLILYSFNSIKSFIFDKILEF